MQNESEEEGLAKNIWPNMWLANRIKERRKEERGKKVYCSFVRPLSVFSHFNFQFPDFYSPSIALTRISCNSTILKILHARTLYREFLIEKSVPGFLEAGHSKSRVMCLRTSKTWIFEIPVIPVSAVHVKIASNLLSHWP